MGSYDSLLEDSACRMFSGFYHFVCVCVSEIGIYPIPTGLFDAIWCVFQRENEMITHGI